MILTMLKATEKKLKNISESLRVTSPGYRSKSNKLNENIITKLAKFAKIGLRSFWAGRLSKMPSEVLRLHCANAPDVIMLLTTDDAYFADVQSDEKGEFIILPNDFKPKRKQRKCYLLKKEVS